MKLFKTKYIPGFIILFSPLLLWAFLVGILSARQNFYLVKDTFKPGFLMVEDYKCRSSQTAPYCFGLGNIIDLEGNIVQVGKSLDLGHPKKIDWEKKKHAVFYRETGRFPVLRNPEDLSLDKKNHIIYLFWSFSGAVIVPILSILGCTKFSNKDENNNKPVANQKKWQRLA